MAKLWVFGDSFTEGFDKYVSVHPNGHEIEWRKKYINWKGYVPKVFGEILAEKLNIEVNNFGMGGTDNYTILDTIINNLDNISDDDIIIIGWSTTIRYRLVNDKNNFESITMWWQNASEHALNRLSVSQLTINEVTLNRKNLAYITELNGYIKLLNKTFSKNKIYHWSPFNERKHFGLNVIKIPKLESIFDETLGQVNDLHYSEPAHYELADYFYHIMNTNNSLI